MSKQKKKSQGILPPNNCLTVCGTIIGTTKTLSMLGRMIRREQAGIGKRWAPHVASHIVVLAKMTRHVEQWIYDEKCYKRNYIDILKSKLFPYCGIEMTWPRIQPIPLEKYEHGIFGNHYVFTATIGRFYDQTTQFRINEWLWSKVKEKHSYDLKSLAEFVGFGDDDPEKSSCAELARDMLYFIGCKTPATWAQGVSPFDIQRHYTATKEITWCLKPIA